jgi:hypothetical protein
VVHPFEGAVFPQRAFLSLDGCANLWDLLYAEVPLTSMEFVLSPVVLIELTT